jgi:hypothetical protein
MGILEMIERCEWRKGSGRELPSATKRRQQELPLLERALMQALGLQAAPPLPQPDPELQ